jgi:hypothetical protein
MASLAEVKQYLAYWFQLGKKVYIYNGDTALLPKPIFDQMNYSAEFERCWALILADRSGDCYLQGTSQTIAELLTPKWDLVGCARCNMPIPLVVAGIPTENCACGDLLTWPNHEIPSPISPVAVRSKLVDLQARLDRIAIRFEFLAVKSTCKDGAVLSFFYSGGTPE